MSSYTALSFRYSPKDVIIRKNIFFDEIIDSLYFIQHHFNKVVELACYVLCQSFCLLVLFLIKGTNSVLGHIHKVHQEGMDLFII